LAPNLGARLQALAAPGQVVVDELTRQLLAASFAAEPLGCLTLEGFAKPVAPTRSLENGWPIADSTQPRGRTGP